MGGDQLDSASNGGASPLADVVQLQEELSRGSVERWAKQAWLTMPGGLDYPTINALTLIAWGREAARLGLDPDTEEHCRAWVEDAISCMQPGDWMLSFIDGEGDEPCTET